VEKYNILDFGAYAQIADIGYRSAMEALGNWKDLPRRGGRLVEAVPRPTLARPISGNSITAPLRKTLAELEDVLARMG
jgi:hypothetical protein